MPNKRADGVKLRAVGVGDDLWEAAQEKAETDHIAVSAVIREALKAWTEHPDAQYDLFTPPPPQR